MGYPQTRTLLLYTANAQYECVIRCDDLYQDGFFTSHKMVFYNVGSRHIIQHRYNTNCISSIYFLCLPSLSFFIFVSLSLFYSSLSFYRSLWSNIFCIDSMPFITLSKWKLCKADESEFDSIAVRKLIKALWKAAKIKRDR